MVNGRFKVSCADIGDVDWGPIAGIMRVGIDCMLAARLRFSNAPRDELSERPRYAWLALSI